MSFETVWSFETYNGTRAELRLYPCDTDPADSFVFPEDIEAVRNGDVLWFDAQVVIMRNGHIIGSDWLGCCAYKSAEDFYASHRDPDPMNRNCSIMRQARGENLVICNYFPSMVREAIEDARHTLQA